MKQEFVENDDYYFQLKKEWEKALPQYPEKKLLEMFPEAKEIIPQKIREWEVIFEKDKGRLKDCFIYINDQRVDDFSTWFLERVASLFLMAPILEAKKHVLRLRRVLSIFSPNGKASEHWQEKVETARKHPIAAVARSNLDTRQAGRNFVSLCPFHNEKTPSFYIYTETNTFHCFGCRENGDVIKLTMHLHGIDFRGAVRMLQN